METEDKDEDDDDEEEEEEENVDKGSVGATDGGSPGRILETDVDMPPRPEVVVTPTRNLSTWESDEEDRTKGNRTVLGGDRPSSSPSSQEHYCLRWTNHGSHVLGVFAQLLRDESLVDVTLAAEGRSLRAHKMVLSACSSFFRTLFITHSDQRHPIVILKDTKFTELESLLQFMYKGEVSVEYGQLPTLLKTAENLRVKGLADVTASAAANAAATASSTPPPPDEEEDEEEDDDDEEDDDEDDADFYDRQMEDVQEEPIGPIVIERDSLTSSQTVLDKRRIDGRRHRRRHLRHHHHNPYGRSLPTHPPPPQLNPDGSVDSLAQHHRLIHRHRGIVDSPLLDHHLHPAVQDLSSSSRHAMQAERRRHLIRRTSQTSAHPPTSRHLTLPQDWLPPDQLQNAPVRRQLKPINHQPPQPTAAEPPAAASQNASATDGMEKRSSSDRNPDDGDHNHRFKTISSQMSDEKLTDGQGMASSTPLDSIMATSTGTESNAAQDLRNRSRMPPSPHSLSPSLTPPAASGSTSHPHRPFRHHWMMDESEESDEVDGDDDEDDNYLQQNRGRRSGDSTSAHPAPVGSPQHLPMVSTVTI